MTNLLYLLLSTVICGHSFKTFLWISWTIQPSFPSDILLDRLCLSFFLPFFLPVCCFASILYTIVSWLGSSFRFFSFLIFSCLLLAWVLSSIFLLLLIITIIIVIIICRLFVSSYHRSLLLFHTLIGSFCILIWLFIHLEVR